MNRHQVLATLTLLVVAVSSALPAFSQPGRPAPASKIIQARSLTVAPDGEGQLWAAWEADNGVDVDVYYSRGTGDDWSPPQPVHRRPDAWDRSPSLVLTADGTPWLAWSSAERAAPERNNLLVSRWAGQRWTDPEAVPLGPISEVTEPVLAAAPDGTLWLAWVGFDGVDDEIFASTWDGRSWSTPQQVSAADDEPSLYDRQPCLVAGDEGEVWLAWTGHQAGVDDEIYASRWTGTEWTAEQAVSQDDGALDVSPSLVLDDRGQPWVAWMGRETEGQHSRRRILVSHWEPSRSTWTFEGVASSPLVFEIDEEGPALSPDGEGGMHLAWVASSTNGAALAYAHWQDGQWTEPGLVRTGVTANTEGLITVWKGSARLLWLDPAPGSQMPLKWASVQDTLAPLSDWSRRQDTIQQILDVDPIPNRYLAFGDSITCFPGCTGEPIIDPYPTRLEGTLDLRVAESEVINAGKQGELTQGGKDRIKGQVSTHQPKYVLIMEGTNDVTEDKVPANVQDHVVAMINNAKNVGVNDVEVMLATIIPRGLNEPNQELLNEKTEEMNAQAIIPAAQQTSVPLCDMWNSFVLTPNWAWDLFVKYSRPDDWVHPNGKGLKLIADTFYGCLLDSYADLEEETTPPDCWIQSVPPSVECGQNVQVHWDGEDDLSYVVDYDLQAKVNDEPWTDWLTSTENTSGIYTPVDSRYGDRLYFHVRGRDVVGNQSAYSDPPAYTDIGDSLSPYEAHVEPLPPVRLAPFTVSWWGADECADIVAYRAQYSVGSPDDWQDWPGHPTPNASGTFSPSPASYGETYYFHVQVQDAAENWSAWSEDEVYTTLARSSMEGRVFNVRHQPVAAAQVQVTPDPLLLEPRPAGFLAYTVTEGDHSITVSETTRYGPLPVMFGLPTDQNISGLEFILPPQDDAVDDGDFEGGDLAAWQVGETSPPTLTAVAHTGNGGVYLDGSLSDSRLGQAITPALGISDPTFSFLVRLAADGPASTLQIELANSGTLSPPVTYTLPVADTGWTHVWYDLAGLASEPLTFTFVVSGSPAILLDEVRLGSALVGGSWLYLPLLFREW